MPSHQAPARRSASTRSTSRRPSCSPRSRRSRRETDAARTQADEYLGALQRERAEFLNYKRRTAEERQRDLGLATEDLIRKVLALADDFDRAIEKRPDAIAADPWVEGVAPSTASCAPLLESEGVTPIDAPAGTPFDPREHEAIANVARHGPARGRRSSSSSSAATGCATASCARRSSPSPAPRRRRRPTELTNYHHDHRNELNPDPERARS